MKKFSLILLFCFVGISMLYASNDTDSVKSDSMDNSNFFIPLDEILPAVDAINDGLMNEDKSTAEEISIDELNDLKDVLSRRGKGIAVALWVKDDVSGCHEVYFCEEIYDGNYFCRDNSFFFSDKKGALIMVSANEIYQVVKATFVRP